MPRQALALSSLFAYWTSHQISATRSPTFAVLSMMIYTISYSTLPAMCCATPKDTQCMMSYCKGRSVMHMNDKYCAHWDGQPSMRLVSIAHWGPPQVCGLSMAKKKKALVHFCMPCKVYHPWPSVPIPTHWHSIPGRLSTIKGIAKVPICQGRAFAI